MFNHDNRKLILISIEIVELEIFFIEFYSNTVCISIFGSKPFTLLNSSVARCGVSIASPPLT